MILILTSDPVAGALLGAWIETLGYAVRFMRPPERPDEAFRRTRPKVCLVDCVDASLCNDEVLGRAAMRGISPIMFGTSRALERVRRIAAEHDIDMLLVPPDATTVEELLKRALAKAG